MNSSASNELFHQLVMVLDDCRPADWGDIISLLSQIQNKKKASIISHYDDFLKFFARGTAIITFSYGIDGVSVEASKYAHTLNVPEVLPSSPSVMALMGFL